MFVVLAACADSDTHFCTVREANIYRLGTISTIILKLDDLNFTITKSLLNDLDGYFEI